MKSARVEFVFDYTNDLNLANLRAELLELLEARGAVVTAAYTDGPYASEQSGPCWKCQVCGVTNHDSNEITNHLINAHHYPVHDAEICTVRVEI